MKSKGQYIACLMATACGLQVIAASHAGAADASAAPKGDVSTMSEVIVTAQKHSENIQRVPIAITALSGKTVAAQGLKTTEDIQFAVPALVYGDILGYGAPYMRGIGSDISAPNIDPSVATYVDGVYIPVNSAIISGLLGVDRIEVLEGPQGTLYGRNADGGAISIHTLTPGPDTSAQFTVSGGSLDLREVSGHLSGKVTDDLDVGLYFGGSWRDPYEHNINPQTSRQTVTTDSNEGIRLKAVWRPTDKIKFTASAESTASNSLEPGVGKGFSQMPATLLGGVVPTGRYDYNATPNHPSYVKNRQESYTLQEHVDLGWADLEGITNYHHLWNRAAMDFDASQIDLMDAKAGIYGENFSQELQLVSPEGQEWKWVAGLYYFKERSGFADNSEGSDIIFAPSGGDIVNSSANTQSYAVFAQTDIPLRRFIPGLTLTLGGRYSIDTQSRYGTDTWLAAGALGQCGGIISLSANCATVIPPPYAPTAAATPYFWPSVSHTWNQFTPKVTLSEQIGPHNMLYFTWAQGYEAGAYNLPSLTSTTPVQPENLTDYEIGSKSTLLDGRLRLNLSAYYYQYTNIQVTISTPQLTNILVNGAKGTAYGFEASGQFRIIDDLTGTLGLSLEHTRYDDFKNFAGLNLAAGCASFAVCNPGATLDVTGNQFPLAPQFVLTAGLDYHHEMANGGVVTGNVNWNHNGGFYWTPQNNLLGSGKQAAYDWVNASIGYTLPGKHWDVSVWAKNLTDAYYLQQRAEIAFFGALGIPAEPRTFGATLRYTLN